MIRFNIPYASEQSLAFVQDALASAHHCGDGPYTRKCHDWLEALTGSKVLLTSSATDALELAALLCDVGPGDEVICPSYTFVSSANAFALRGAHLRFVDSCELSPNMDLSALLPLVNEKTKVIVVVDYAGCGVDVAAIRKLAPGCLIVEDAAQGLCATHNGRKLGTLGDLGCYSFHETKNVGCGEGGALVVNNLNLFARAEVLREKGTNRSAFFRGAVDKYTWIDLGSSFLPSEITAALLYGNLLESSQITARRLQVWDYYVAELTERCSNRILQVSTAGQEKGHNGHIFNMTFNDADARDRFIGFMMGQGVQCTFHYQPLHLSPYGRKAHNNLVSLPNACKYGDGLVRLPNYFTIKDSEVEHVVKATKLALERLAL